MKWTKELAEEFIQIEKDLRHRYTQLNIDSKAFEKKFLISHGEDRVVRFLQAQAIVDAFDVIPKA